MSYIKESKSSKTLTSVGGSVENDERSPSFFIFPKKQSRLTFLKAPMAHKTFSQEQFVTKHYTLNVSFTNSISKNSLVPGVNNSLFLSLGLRQETVPFETNLIFLKRLKTNVTCSDREYMSIY